MTLFARSDLAAVSVSVAHGGCGRSHSRPAPGGSPDPVWKFDCADGCEDHLRHDPHWAVTLAKLPETFDEEAARKDFEQRGALDERKLMAMALAKLTGLEIPDTIAHAITGRAPHIPGQMVCPQGHGNPPGNAFCGDCGAPMHGTPVQAALPAVQKAAEPPKPAPGQKPRRLRDARLDELQALARNASIEPEGTRADLIARLAAAGVTNNDLAALLVAA